jgi:hypothetical protein
MEKQVPIGLVNSKLPPQEKRMKTISMVLLTSCFLSSPLHPSELFEDFDSPGKPGVLNGVDWRYTDQMLPVENWEEIVPGDGFAYLRIDADRSNDRDQSKQKWPFQMISLSPVGPGHRLEMRAKNTVISGVGSFIFTYQQADGIFDEIDIEIVGDDAATLPEKHPTDTTGWTDARFNTWADSDTRTGKPHVTHKKPIRDKSGKKTSHQDGQFHVYTIDWREDGVDFFIDGVHQQTITSLVPDSPARLLVGMRHMSWTGKLDWSGIQTMIIDWIRVEPVER